MSSNGDRALGVAIVVGTAGIVGGYLWATVKRAWRDVADARSAYHSRRGLAWSATVTLLLVGFGLVVLIAAVIGQRNG